MSNDTYVIDLSSNMGISYNVKGHSLYYESLEVEPTTSPPSELPSQPLIITGPNDVASILTYYPLPK